MPKLTRKHSVILGNIDRFFITKVLFISIILSNQIITAQNKSVNSLSKPALLELAQQYSKQSEEYELKGDHKNAYDYYAKYIKLNDSITNMEDAKKQARLEMNFEFNKKEADDKAEQQKKDAVTRIIIYSISGGLFLSLVMAFFIFRSYQQKKKANVIISKQKEEMEIQKDLVEEKQKEVLDSITYARRIQRALLTSENNISRYLIKAMHKEQ